VTDSTVAEPPVRIVEANVLADDWARLTKYVIDYRRADGTWERQVRQAYDRGHGAVLLPYDPKRGTVLLVRQFRLVAWLNGDGDPHLIEACAGLLDANDPETAIAKEAEEELGIRLRDARRVFAPYMSPGSVTERLTFFIAEYEPSDRIGAGGGAAHEGENIEVLELPLERALAMVETGEIADAKTIMLLQHVRLKGLA
jgi:nudix-type nucleoside diphosphatase (YffH/AdpP family)